VEPGPARLARVGFRGGRLKGIAHLAAHSHFACLSASRRAGPEADALAKASSFHFQGPGRAPVSAEEFRMRQPPGRALYFRRPELQCPG
jgi:hypothetical protein